MGAVYYILVHAVKQTPSNPKTLTVTYSVTPSGAGDPHHIPQTPTEAATLFARTLRNINYHDVHMTPAAAQEEFRSACADMESRWGVLRPDMDEQGTEWEGNAKSHYVIEGSEAWVCTGKEQVLELLTEAGKAGPAKVQPLAVLAADVLTTSPTTSSRRTAELLSVVHDSMLARGLNPRRCCCCGTMFYVDPVSFSAHDTKEAVMEAVCSFSPKSASEDGIWNRLQVMFPVPDDLNGYRKQVAAAIDALVSQNCLETPPSLRGGGNPMYTPSSLDVAFASRKGGAYSKHDARKKICEWYQFVVTDEWEDQFDTAWQSMIEEEILNLWEEDSGSEDEESHSTPTSDSPTMYRLSGTKADVFARVSFWNCEGFNTPAEAVADSYLRRSCTPECAIRAVEGLSEKEIFDGDDVVIAYSCPMFEVGLEMEKVHVDRLETLVGTIIDSVEWWW
ncbi:hypothetical protein HK104_009881 [Borealophlyctis nickersoniae]|nr:hypothetical protein HK104_009881 [Borealophlyctis nickersoniae]